MLGVFPAVAGGVGVGEGGPVAACDAIAVAALPKVVAAGGGVVAEAVAVVVVAASEERHSDLYGR